MDALILLRRRKLCFTSHDMSFPLCNHCAYHVDKHCEPQQDNEIQMRSYSILKNFSCNTGESCLRHAKGDTLSACLCRPCRNIWGKDSPPCCFAQDMGIESHAALDQGPHQCGTEFITNAGNTLPPTRETLHHQRGKHFTTNAAR